MDDGSGGLTLDLQAKTVVDNILYGGSAPCPSCGIIMNPVQVMSRVLCNPCHENRMEKRVKGKMA